MKTIKSSLFGLMALCACITLVHAQNVAFTYQGQVLDNGVNFTGMGEFKFALVTSLNANQTATATANAPNGGYITGYTVTAGGSGYVTAPAVTMAGGGGSGAAATAHISGGAVTSISVNNTGDGHYTSAPTVRIAAPPPNVSYTTYWSNDGTSSAGSEPAAAVGVSVNNGLFAVVLGDTTQANMAPIDSSLFDQAGLQLRLWFSDGVHGVSVLDPPQSLTPAPYASVANSAKNLQGTVSASQLTGTIPAGVVSGSYGNSVTFNNAGNNFTGNGIGLTGVNAATLNGLSTANFWQTGGNAGANPANGAFLGTTDNEPLEFHVNGARALRLEPAWDAPHDLMVPNVIGGSWANVVVNGALGATIGGGGDTNGHPNLVTGAFGTVSGGKQNTAGESATVGGGFINNAGGYVATVGGGEFNTAGSYAATVGGGEVNMASGKVATVGGGIDNFASGYAATVGGGSLNWASGYAATVGGGSNNIASGDYAVVGGGTNNIASGLGTTVSGGYENSANSYAATVSGGYENTASELYATVGGGVLNTASGYSATVSGGGGNIASGICSFAAGQYAHATDDYSFAWGNGSRQALSQGPKSFMALATGGFWIFSGDYPAGIKLAPGASSWTTLSDRNAKKNFRPVDTQAVLEKLAAIPIEQWNYIWEKDTDVPNLGPMAQDFKAAFYPGRDDKGITTLEFDGVELAAIQGLNQKLSEQEAALKKKDSQINEMRQAIIELQILVRALSVKAGK